MNDQDQLTEFDELSELFSSGLNLYLSWAKQRGLSANEFFVLYYLSQSEVCTQKEIADEWSIPKQTVSVVCKNLLDKGWLQYAEGATDKREKRLSLTEVGKSVAMPMVAELSRIELRTAEEFGKEKCAELIVQIRQLLTLFQRNLQNEHLKKS